MNVRELVVGQQFRFAAEPQGGQQGHPWEYRGNCWYGWAYSGGPYRVVLPDTCEVTPLKPIEYVAQPDA